MDDSEGLDASGLATYLSERVGYTEELLTGLEPVVKIQGTTTFTPKIILEGDKTKGLKLREEVRLRQVWAETERVTGPWVGSRR